jgi:hypothetical protein
MSRHKRTRGKLSTKSQKRGPQGLLLAAAAGFMALAGVAAIVAFRGGPPGAPGQAGARAGAPPGTGAAGSPALIVTPAAVELGEVSQAKGLVTVETAVANAGSGDLAISEMETTCGCTKAALVIEGKAGPWYGMRGHGDWPIGWSARLRPGQRATLRVQYDPDAHGIYRGPIDRTVFIYSSDPRQPRYAVRLTGTQVP